MTDAEILENVTERLKGYATLDEVRAAATYWRWDAGFVQSHIRMSGKDGWLKFYAHPHGPIRIVSTAVLRRLYLELSQTP